MVTAEVYITKHGGGEGCSGAGVEWLGIELFYSVTLLRPKGREVKVKAEVKVWWGTVQLCSCATVPAGAL